MKIIQTYSFQNKKEVGGGGWRWGKSGGGEGRQAPAIMSTLIIF